MNKLLKITSSLVLAITTTSTYAICSPSVNTATPTSRFQDLGNGKVKDKQTGLIWQRCTLGQVWNINGCSDTIEAKTLTWHEALKQTKALGNGYRLPNIRELQSIIDIGCSNPAINTTIFPNTPGATWSSSPVAGNPASAWYVDFTNGVVSNFFKTNLYYARAVRSE